MHEGWDDAAGGAGDEPPAGAERPPAPAGVLHPQQEEKLDPQPDTSPSELESPSEPESPSDPGLVELPVVLAKLAAIRELADEVMASPLWQHSNPQSVAAVEQSAVAVRKVQAAHLTLLADMDGRVGTLPGAPAGYEARTFLRHALHRTMGQAKADLAAAHALLPDADPADRGLPRLERRSRLVESPATTSTPPSGSCSGCRRNSWPFRCWTRMVPRSWMRTVRRCVPGM